MKSETVFSKGRPTTEGRDEASPLANSKDLESRSGRPHQPKKRKKDSSCFQRTDRLNERRERNDIVAERKLGEHARFEAVKGGALGTEKKKNIVGILRKHTQEIPRGE